MVTCCRNDYKYYIEIGEFKNMKNSKIIFVSLMSILLLCACGNNEKKEEPYATPSTPEEVVNYTLTESLPYAGIDSTKYQVMDIYTPNNQKEKTPGVVLIHGGAFKFGDEKMFQTTAKWLANNGFAVASISYRLCTTDLFRAAVSDTKAAIRYLRKNAATYNINENQIVTWGESAGAYLSVMSAMTGGTNALDGDVKENIDISSKVQYCVDFYGPLFVKIYKDGGLCNFLGITSDEIDSEKNKELVSSSDPLSYVDNFTKETVPQFLIQHGGSDTTVSNEESKHLYEGLKSVYGEEKASLTIMSGLKHMDAGFYTDDNL